MAYKVLFIGAHHEEIEAELPNTVIALAKAGCEVHILNPIGGWNWNAIKRLEGDGRKRTVEAATNAAAVLGAVKTIWDFPIAQCHRYQAEILDKMIDFLREFNPDIVMIHWPFDMHADHRLIAHISQHAINVADDLSTGVMTRLQYLTDKEIYAFQTGVTQAYHFIPDLLVTTDEQSMAQADQALEQFLPTAGKQEVEGWKCNVRVKANYWGAVVGMPAEALKFLGPQLPLNGFLLKKILGDKLMPNRLESFYYFPSFEL